MNAQEIPDSALHAVPINRFLSEMCGKFKNVALPSSEPIIDQRLSAAIDTAVATLNFT